MDQAKFTRIRYFKEVCQTNILVLKIFQVVFRKGKDFLYQEGGGRLCRGTYPALTTSISTPTLVTELLRMFSPGKNVVRLP